MQSGGVAAHGIIALDDVRAIRSQLGEPSDFGDTVVVHEGDEKPARKLYRDLEHATLGGVMSGIATYFRVDLSLVRIIGVLGAIVSLGAFVPLYILLWALIPAAKTASQRLELAGKPVTLEAINEMGEAQLSHDAQRVRRILLVLFGAFAAGIALVVFIGIVVESRAFFVSKSSISSGFFNATAVLLILAGLAFVMFMSVIAYGLIRQVWRKPFTQVLIGLTVIGLLTFGSSLYIARLGTNAMDRTTLAAWQKIDHYPAASLQGIKHIVVDSTVPVFYVVGEPSLQITGADTSAPTISVEGETATILYTGHGTQIDVTGPALSTVTVVRYSFGYTAVGGEMSMTIDSSSTATIRGSLSKLQLLMKGSGAVFNGEGLAVNDVRVERGAPGVGEADGAEADLATIRTLEVLYPEACSVSQGLKVSVRGITGRVAANGKNVTVPFEDGCFGLKLTQP